jgi:hypothetical protein
VDSLSNNKFNNPSIGEVTTPQMVKEIANFVDEKPLDFYSLIIGTDSQAKAVDGKKEVDFVTAIVIHRQGKGGRYFWHKDKMFREISLKEKIWHETITSITVAQELVPLIREVISPTKYDLEIHIDVGPIGPTREMIKEVVGMVNGSGFKAKTKPESWGASKVADKYT